MSSVRSVVIVAAVAMAVLLLVCPPFMAIDPAAARTRHSGLGHHPFWRPPTPAMAEEVLSQLFGPSPGEGETSLRVALNRVGLTVDMAAILVGALAALAAERAYRRRQRRKGRTD